MIELLEKRQWREGTGDFCNQLLSGGMWGAYFRLTGFGNLYYRKGFFHEEWPVPIDLEVGRLLFSRLRHRIREQRRAEVLEYLTRCGD